MGLVCGCQYLGWEKEFEGKIVYRTALAGPNAEMLSLLFKPEQVSLTVYHKGDWLRFEESGQTILVDYQKDSITLLASETRQYFTASLEEARKHRKPSVRVERLPEEREILGHVCTGYKVWGDKGDTIIYWEAKDLGISSAASQMYLLLPPGVVLKGVPLAFEQPIPDTPLRLRREAEEIQPGEVEESIFQVPATYTRIEKKDL
ncbi:MAG: hypothetical protein D6750_10805 [Bacteroidetes bacterium]|nr:MAG: hypothetical protein D6750_10805 [Bacteroidota bacterium]